MTIADGFGVGVIVGIGVFVKMAVDTTADGVGTGDVHAFNNHIPNKVISDSFLIIFPPPTDLEHSWIQLPSA
ncbi:hypothetical protein KA005_18460, partial [bacterium]|nr:hypothetical protein [bacterium]